MGAVSATAFRSSKPPAPKAETFRGRIVAYSNVKMCASANALWEMIIRIEGSPTKGPSKVIRVEFSLPCDEKLPKWVTRNVSVQTFQVTREPHELDAILNEFMDCKNEVPPTSCAVPMWKPVSAVEDEALPFGQRLPTYDSVVQLYFRSYNGFIAGGLRGFRRLSTAPTTIHVELNEWIRFKTPGQYRVTVISGRTSEVGSSSYGDLGVTSNSLTLSIVPATKEWQESTLQTTLQVLRSSGPPAVPSSNPTDPRTQAIKTCVT